jgi:hypothetical protein
MSGVFGTFPTAAGYLTDNLILIENRVQTALLAQVANTADNNVNQLRNDEAPVLGLATPIPSA